jgi:DNA-directed RNA polymerase specialized sigma24 family protein
VRRTGVAVEAVARASEVFDAVYAAHHAPLVRLAYVTTGSMPAAEDVAQDVFVECLRRGRRRARPAPRGGLTNCQTGRRGVLQGGSCPWCRPMKA